MRWCGLFLYTDDMSCFFENGLQFTCKRCSRCCRGEPGFVFLSQTDLTNLCRWFNLTEVEFIDVYCRFVPLYESEHVLCLKETPSYDCILWHDGCTAYGARPVQCSTYPFWSGFLQDEQSWQKASASCPGMNNGKLWSKEEICAARDAYEKNKLLHCKREGELCR